MKNKIATIAELLKIQVNENGEGLIRLDTASSLIRSDYRRTDTDVHAVWVRESVLAKLKFIQRQLASNMQLLLVEGYRPYGYQERYYLRELLSQAKAHPDLEFDALLEQAHQFVALPSVSGHPTGGAVDITLMLDGKEVDMGGQIADFSCPRLLPTYSPFISHEQAKWRIFLSDLMVSEGFAPFYGEWWHFSYGDREWAAFYHRPESIYSPVYDHPVLL